MNHSILTRRQLCAGAAAVAIASPARASLGSSHRAFDIIRAGKTIGEHRVTVRKTADGFQTECNTDITVKVFGLVAYRYALAYKEEYDLNLNLMSLRGSGDENGQSRQVSAIRSADQIEIDGSEYSGGAPLSAMPTSYWNIDALEASTWISTQDGRLYDLSVTPENVSEAPANTARSVRVTDGLKFTVDIFYDIAGEWIGNAFDARGERAIFKMRDSSGALNL